MNRRGFLQLLAGAAPAAILAAPAIELIERTIFLPPACGWATRGAGQVWKVDSLCGYSRQLSEILRAQVTPLVRFRQFQENPLERLLRPAAESLGNHVLYVGP